MSNYNINDFYPRTGQEIKDDGTVVNEANGVNPDGSQNVKTIAKKQTTIQTHNAVSIPLSSNNSSAWISTDGFDNIAVNILNDNNSTTFGCNLLWSTDGVNVQGAESLISTGGPVWNNSRSAITTTKAQYVKVLIINGDGAAPHTFNAWAYLKS